MKIVLYTSIFGEYDSLREPLVKQSCQMACLTDGSYESQSWEIVYATPSDDPCRSARWAKMHPHELFPDADITVWIDGSVQPKVDLAAKAESLLAGEKIAMFAHPQRKCAYEEAKFCILHKKDDESLIRNQMQRYHEAGFPQNYGLVASGILVRRNSPDVNKLNEMWWNQIEGGSKRDQLGFSYCHWRLGVRMRLIPGSIYDGKTCELYRYHQKED